MNSEKQTWKDIGLIVSIQQQMSAGNHLCCLPMELVIHIFLEDKGDNSYKLDVFMFNIDKLIFSKGLSTWKIKKISSITF